MTFGVLEKSIQVLQSPGNLFLEKGRDPGPLRLEIESKSLSFHPDHDSHSLEFNCCKARLK